MKKLLLLLIICTITSINIFGQAIPKQIDYQGVLKTAAGVIVPDGNYPLTFKIYNEPTGGTALWTEAQTVAVANGIFSVHLGSITLITTVPFNRIHFLGITIDADPELLPRTMLTPSPYSFMAIDVMDNTVTSAKLVDLTITGTDIANNTIGPEKLNFSPGTGTIGGSGTTNYLPLFTNSTTLGNSVIYQNSTRIGINNASPDFALTVNSDPVAGLGLKISRSNGGLILSLMEDSQPSGLRGWSFDVFNQKLTIKTAGDNGFTTIKELITFERDGFVGIGTNNPITNMQLVHNQFVPEGGFTLQQTSNSNRWQFYVSQSTSYLRLLYNDNAMGQFNNTNGNYEPTSDMRLKRNVMPLTGMLDIVNQLQPVSYQMINSNDNEERSYGLIAQDVEKILPEIVSVTKGNDGDGIENLRTLSYTELIPILIKAVQEQQKLIEDLTQRIKNVEPK